MSGWMLTRWWRVVGTDEHTNYCGGVQVWCETSSEEEAREALTLCPYPARLERHQVRSERRWVVAP
jgi:hypothetical protein